MRAKNVIFLSVALLVVAAMTGCAPSASSNRSTLSDAVSASLSSVQTATLAVTQLTKDRDTKAVALTALGDMLKQATEAQTQVSELDAASAADDSRRDRTAAGIAAAITALTDGRQTISGTSGAKSNATILVELAAATKQLRALQKKLGS